MEHGLGIGRGKATRDDHRISTRLLTYFRSLNDPRTPILAMPATKDTVELNDTTKVKNSAGADTIIITPKTPFKPAFWHSLVVPIAFVDPCRAGCIKLPCARGSICAVAFVRVIAGRLGAGESYEAFCERNPDLFDRSLSAYGREDRPCPRCGAPIRREKFMNRSSYSCPKCQPRPRGL